MITVRKYFPDILPDNEAVYFSHLEGIIDSIDELATMQIAKMSHAYQFRLAPSMPKYNEALLEEILKFHNVFNIKLNLSKSIKASGTINFEIVLEN